MNNAEKGKLLVISGPSGAGKSTVIGKLMELREDVCFSVSVTTRPARPNEEDGKDYFFVTPQRFQELAEGGFLLEHAEYVGNRYGTPRGYVESRLLEGKSVVLDIEVQGAAQVQRNCPDAVTVFILPPSGEELERRLRHRNTDTDEKIRERLLQAKRECAEAGRYGYIVLLVNLVARRARDISQKAEEEGESLDRKPISTAIDEVYTGKLTITSQGTENEEIE